MTGTETPDATPGALALVENLRLGETVILHNRESGAMVATNAFGALLLDQLRAHPEALHAPEAPALFSAVAAELLLPAADVREAVEATLARWDEDGLFLTAARPFPGAVPYRPAAHGSRLDIALGPRSVRFCSEDEGLAEDIARAVAPMGLTLPSAAGTGAASAGARAAVRLDVIGTDDDTAGAGLALFRDGEPVWGVAGYELTRFHVLREIMDVLCGSEHLAAHLHASAVARDGAALVFAGASGSGKSTLATLLLGAGAALVADDHVALGADGASLRAFPTRPNLKPGSEAVPEVDAVIAGQGGRTEDFIPAARLEAGEAVRLAGFVFPRYDPGGDDVLTPLDPAEALRRLIQTGSRVSRSTRSLAPLARALNRGPVHELAYRDSDFAVEACLGLLCGPPRP